MKPHKAVSKDTTSRWIKVTLGLAGIGGNVFKPHSTRAAVTSAAAKHKDILNVAGWSNEKTFAQFYNTPLNSNADVFSHAIIRR